jgi:hypothetical protein
MGTAVVMISQIYGVEEWDVGVAQGCHGINQRALARVDFPEDLLALWHV